VRIGLFDRVPSLTGFADDLRAAADAGLSSYWVTQAFGTDTLTVLAALARDVDLRIGTAVVPTYPRHPMVLAQQALTTNLLLGGRLALGIGPSHPTVVGPCWGLSYDHPARHMEEYLQALTGALTQRVRFSGELITARGDLDVPGAQPPPVLVSALGPRMLELTGRLAAGTVTWMVGPRTLAELTVPTIRSAAAAAGRPEPEVVACVPVCRTDDPDRALAGAQDDLGWYDGLPSYRSALARAGLRSGVQLAVAGDGRTGGAAVAAYRAAGATTLAVQPFGSAEEKAATVRLAGVLAAEGA
jgi:F420-dependent oxidoreductase-like protein